MGILRQAYCALVQSALTYCLPAWGSFAPEQVWNRLNIDVCNPGSRIISGPPRWTRIEALILAAGTHTVQNLYAARTALLLDHTVRTSQNTLQESLPVALSTLVAPEHADRPPAGTQLANIFLPYDLDLRVTRQPFIRSLSWAQIGAEALNSSGLVSFRRANCLTRPLSSSARPRTT